MNTVDITHTGVTLDNWVKTKHTDPRPLDGFLIEGFFSESYKHQSTEGLVMARFFLGTTEVHRAWGWAHEECCSYHLLFLQESPTPRPGCPPVQVNCEKNPSLQYTTESDLLSIPITLIT
jgi:hypothetical protein